MNARERISWNLRGLRIRAGLSQEALADEARIDRAYVGKIERAEANVTVDLLETLAAVLKTDIAILFRGKRTGARAPKPLKKGPKGSR